MERPSKRKGKQGGRRPGARALDNARGAVPLSLFSLLDKAPDPAFIYTKQTIAYVNEQAVRFFGASKPGELLGKNIFQRLPARYHQKIKQRMKFLEKRPANEVMELNYLRLDGKEVETEASSARVTFEGKPAILVMVRDISRRKAAETALLRMRYAVDHASDIVYWIKKDSRLEYANDAACRLLGYQPDEFYGMPLSDLDMDFKKEDWPRLWQNLKDNKAKLRLSHQRAKDGHVVPMEVMGNYEVFEGTEYCVAFCRDISARLKDEEERHKLQAQVQQAQKLESLGVLAGGIAHDFNNLLLVILGNLELARQRLAPDSDSVGNLKSAEDASHKAADLCRQMLAYSGRGRFEIRPVEWSEVVRSLEHILQVSVSKKAMLRYNFAPNLPLVMADATQLRQVVMNLVINASEAIGEKSGVISVSTGAMLCDRAYLEETYLDEKLEPGLYAYVEISDTGSGMDAETRAKIFDPFFTTKFTGRGLGLAAVLGIVRGHKGAVKIYSELGKGTAFKVLLPATQEPPQASLATAKTRAWKGKGAVLLVDDEETVVAVGSQMIKNLGFRVFTARDGIEALHVFKAHQTEISCVILDLTMPHMDGEETFRELRRLKQDVRVVMTSGYNEQDVIQRFAGKGLTGFLQKPYLMDALAEKLKSVLEK